MPIDPNIYTNEELQQVIADVGMSRIGPTDWHWVFHFEPIDTGSRKGWLVWVSFDRVDVNTREFGRGRGRDVVVWSGTGKSGIIKTLWMQVELVVKHELFHAFHYKGRELFDPHAPVDSLHGISGQATHDSYHHWQKPTQPQGMARAVAATGEIA